MKILGIETSCDETAAAVVEERRGRLLVLSNVVASQIKIHAKTGGVVPEVAARSHVEAIIPVIEQAIRKANVKCQISNVKCPLDAIAVTVGPGLITSLRVGVDTARALAAAWGTPVVAVNHLEGHIYANWLPPLFNIGFRTPVSVNLRSIPFPALVLIVSGGHTELVLMRKHLDYQIIGATRDDAAGEAFDKVAKILGLGYPGGPAVSKLAEKGNPQAIDFPRPMIDSSDFDFSFSGLKTAVLYHLKQLRTTNYLPTSEHNPELAPRLLSEAPLFWSSNPKGRGEAGRQRARRSYVLRTNVCASFEQAIVDVLVAKTVRAAKKYKAKTVLLGGGVAANNPLRIQLGVAVNQQLRTTNYVLPTLNYTTDNAAMIAAAGAMRVMKKQFTPWQRLAVDPNLSL